MLLPRPCQSHVRSRSQPSLETISRDKLDKLSGRVHLPQKPCPRPLYNQFRPVNPKNQRQLLVNYHRQWLVDEQRWTHKLLLYPSERLFHQLHNQVKAFLEAPLTSSCWHRTVNLLPMPLSEARQPQGMWRRVIKSIIGRTRLLTTRQQPLEDNELLRSLGPPWA